MNNNSTRTWIFPILLGIASVVACDARSPEGSKSNDLAHEDGRQESAVLCSDACQPVSACTDQSLGVCRNTCGDFMYANSEQSDEVDVGVDLAVCSAGAENIVECIMDLSCSELDAYLDKQPDAPCLDLLNAQEEAGCPCPQFPVM